MRDGLKHWKHVMMLTLTLDPKRYNGPEDAFRSINKERRVATTIKSLHKRGHLGSREYTLTVEFHKSGWPHYHVLVPEQFVGKHELQRTWGRGVVWYSKHKMRSVAHAINYATKYITKTDEDGGWWFPDWVMDYDGAVRRFSTSHRLLPPERKPAKRKEGRKRGRRTRTPRERAAACSNETKLIEKFEKFVDVPGTGGEEVKKHSHTKIKGVLDMPWSECKEMPTEEINRLLEVQEWNQKQLLIELDFERHFDAREHARKSTLKVHRTMQLDRM